MNVINASSYKRDSKIVRFCQNFQHRQNFEVIVYLLLHTVQSVSLCQSFSAMSVKISTGINLSAKKGNVSIFLTVLNFIVLQKFCTV